jgi:hypothetical protein
MAMPASPGVYTGPTSLTTVGHRCRLPAIPPLRYNGNGDLAMTKRTNRVAWGLAAVLAVVVLSGVGVLGLWLRAYWIAKHDGDESQLAGAYLPGADLHGAALAGANLHGAVLRSADLREANFSDIAYFPGGGAGLEKGADLRQADLRHAQLGSANLIDADLRSADLRGANLTGAYFTGARFDEDTRWPAGFDPIKQGAIKVK